MSLLKLVIQSGRWGRCSFRV